MTALTSYQLAAQAYADGVRALYRQPSQARQIVTEAAATPILPLASLAARAARLVPLSAEMTRSAASGLTDPDPAVRADVATQLLAKALTDLDISTQLLQAAMQEAAATDSGRGLGEDSSPFAVPADLEASLRLLESAPGTGLTATHRAVTVLPTDLAAARAQLSQTTTEALSAIRDRAGKTGQAAISGMLVLGMGEIVQAAGVVGMDIAAALGLSQQASRLYTLCSDFAMNAYNALVELLGPTVAQTAVQQAVAWVNDVVQGEQFGKLLDKLYETAQTGQQISQVITASQAPLEQFIAAIVGVDALNGRYTQQIGLIEKLLKGLRFLGSIPATALPYGRVLMAAAYLITTTYVILAGADYVDAERLKFLNRVPGVRLTVEANLKL